MLGLDLHVQSGELRFRDPATGEDLRTYEESEDQRAVAEKERAAERDRAEAAERALARFRLGGPKGRAPDVP